MAWVMSFVSSSSSRALGRMVASGTRAGVSARSARAWSSRVRAASTAAMAAGSTVAQPWLSGRPAAPAAAEMASVEHGFGVGEPVFGGGHRGGGVGLGGVGHQPGGVVGFVGVVVERVEREMRSPGRVARGNLTPGLSPNRA